MYQLKVMLKKCSQEKRSACHLVVNESLSKRCKIVYPVNLESMQKREFCGTFTGVLWNFYRRFAELLREFCETFTGVLWEFCNAIILMGWV